MVLADRASWLPWPNLPFGSSGGERATLRAIQPISRATKGGAQATQSWTWALSPLHLLVTFEGYGVCCVEQLLLEWAGQQCPPTLVPPALWIWRAVESLGLSPALAPSLWAPGQTPCPISATFLICTSVANPQISTLLRLTSEFCPPLYLMLHVL